MPYDVLAWIVIFFGGTIVVCVTCIISTVIEAHYDKKFPERLQRYSIEQYKQGVQDATPHLEINK